MVGSRVDSSRVKTNNTARSYQMALDKEVQRVDSIALPGADSNSSGVGNMGLGALALCEEGMVETKAAHYIPPHNPKVKL